MWKENQCQKLAEGIEEELSKKTFLDTWEQAALLFYLGMAHYGLGKEEEAVKRFAASKQADAIFRPDRRQFPELALTVYDNAQPKRP